MERKTEMMSNVDIVRAVYPGTGFTGDIAALVHPDVVAFEAESLPYGGRYDGVEGFMGLLAELGKHWETIACNELQFIAQDDWVFAVFRLQATARSTGREADQRIAELWRLKDGKIIFLQPFYFDTHAIRKVFGMSLD